jgi:predicted DNA-binding protein
MKEKRKTLSVYLKETNHKRLTSAKEKTGLHKSVIAEQGIEKRLDEIERVISAGRARHTELGHTRGIL